MVQPTLSPLERRWRELAPPQPVAAARATYELAPRWGSGRVPFVDVPYDARSESHWTEAARVADFAGRLPAGGSRVLDIGPGDGWPALPMAAMLPATRVTGVDASPLRVRVCTENARRLSVRNARFLLAGAESLPIAGGTVDLVTASYSLEEAGDPPRVFREIRRVLRPGGLLRAAYQLWDLGADEVETVTLGAGKQSLIYGYTRRLQDPARERRYALVLPAAGEAAAIHELALVEASRHPEAYGETRLAPGSPLGAPLLERLAPLADRSLFTELVRWRTAWLVEELQRAGFRDVRSTLHTGEAARAFVRALRDRKALESLAPHFDVLTRALGESLGELPGTQMVTARRPLRDGHGG